jgi:hypothetical protein
MVCASMSWLVEDNSYGEVIAEIERQSDRAASLIAASLLEDRLLKLIKSTLVGHKTIEDKMFKGSGPVASFSAKIDLAFVMGLFDDDVHKRMHTIREIRNEFAHNVRPLHFASQRPKALCANLTPSAKVIALAKAPILAGNPVLKVALVPTDIPREQFMNAVKLYLLVFRAQILKHERSRARKEGKAVSPTASFGFVPSPGKSH